MSAEEIGECLAAEGFSVRNMTNCTAYEKGEITFEIRSFDSRSDAAQFYSKAVMNLDSNMSDVSCKSTKSTASYSKHILKTTDKFCCVLQSGNDVIRIKSPLENEEYVCQLLKALRY